MVDDNVPMLCLDEKGGHWMTVVDDVKKDRNVLDRAFREDPLVTF